MKEGIQGDFKDGAVPHYETGLVGLPYIGIAIQWSGWVENLCFFRVIAFHCTYRENFRKKCFLN